MLIITVVLEGDTAATNGPEPQLPRSYLMQ